MVKENNISEETIEDLLGNNIVQLESIAKLIHDCNDTTIVKIDGDALYAIYMALKLQILHLKKTIFILDKTYHLISTNHKDAQSEEKPYLCKKCGKTYSLTDYLILENPWNDHPCTFCGGREYTVTAKNGKTTDA